MGRSSADRQKGEGYRVLKRVTEVDDCLELYALRKTVLCNAPVERDACECAGGVESAAPLRCV